MEKGRSLTDEKLEERESAGPRRPAQNLDVHKLAVAIKELNLARTNAGIYPFDHPQIAASLDRAFAALRDILAQGPPLTLGIAMDCLVVDGERLNHGNLAFRKFAAAMAGRNVISVTFHPALTKEDLFNFQRILNLTPAETRSRGGIGALLMPAGLETIAVREVDYGRFRLTDEEEISPDRGTPGQNAADDLWLDFVEQATGGRFDAAQAGDAGWDVDPAWLSEFLDAHPSASTEAAEGLEEFLAKQRGRRADPRAFRKLNELLLGVRPELRSRLLALTFDYMNEQAEPILSEIDDSLLLQMLEQARGENKAVSPALMDLARALSGYGRAGASRDLEAAGRLNKIGALFVQEKRTEYTPEDYRSTLARMGQIPERDKVELGEPAGDASTAGTEREAGEGTFKTALTFQIGEALTKKRVVSHICRLVAGLLERELDPVDYEIYAAKIAEFAPQLVQGREFELLLQMAVLFRRAAAEKPEPLSRIAEDAGQILARRCLPGVMDAFASEDYPASDRVLIDLLNGWGAEAAEEAGRRLNDQRPATVRNLVEFLKDRKDLASLPALRPLLAHEDELVRVDALAALLALGDDNSSEFLRAAFRSKSVPEALSAIALAGRFKVAETVDDLVSIIKEKPWRRADPSRTVEIIRALGKIGDARTLPVLEKLARKRKLLRAGGLRDVRLAVFEAMENFPSAERARLVRRGLKSKDSHIRAICRALQKAGDGASSRGPCGGAERSEP